MTTTVETITISRCYSDEDDGRETILEVPVEVETASGWPPRVIRVEYDVDQAWDLAARCWVDLSEVEIDEVSDHVADLRRALVDRAIGEAEDAGEAADGWRWA